MRDPSTSLRHEAHAYAITTGVDVVIGLAHRKALVIGARYTPLTRSEAQQQMGLGTHAVRVGVGLGYRLNR